MKVFGRSAAALVCVLALASCTSDKPAPEAANLCGITAASEEETLMREVLGVKEFTTKVYTPTEKLVDMSERALPVIRPEKTRFFTNVCEYGTGDGQQDFHVTFLTGWSLRSAQAPLGNGAVYELNGAQGLATDSRSRLLVQCDMPGELGEQSRKVWLTGDANFAPSRADVDQVTKDRRTVLTYLMARRVTEALGCENKPLAQPPVVKSLPTTP
ncbi:hypothetical protein OG730_26750 [Streptomyces sp. NBC_01298]|uniref:hypothetical protein n=1 Tax=Streptomyces sp. NBC_01298 TaxID=2903817 RepID=UPI002E12A089|nr:hypothetical protein OG730_26750 [Streptomyces sp. NBC_01298]